MSQEKKKRKEFLFTCTNVQSMTLTWWVTRNLVRTITDVDYWKFLIFVFHVYLFVWWRGTLQSACACQRRTCRSLVFPSVMWVPRIKLQILKLGSKHFSPLSYLMVVEISLVVQANLKITMYQSTPLKFWSSCF